MFLILLYQMYIYKTDYSRTNEFGQKLTDEAAKKLLEQTAGSTPEGRLAAEAKGGEKKDDKLESKKDR